jgi:hypothetical protein
VRGEEGEEEKEKRKRKEERPKNEFPPQATPAAGVAIFQGNFTMLQITKKKQLPCGFSWLLLSALKNHM